MIAVPALTDRSQAPTRRSGHLADALRGARAMVPWLLGVAPFGLVIGITATEADVPTLAGWATGPLIYAGSAQVASIELLDSGAAPVVVIIAALAINLRLVLYSAAMAVHWDGTPRWWRALAAYLLVDPSLAVGVDAYERTSDRGSAHAQYLGGAVVLWVTWLVAIAIGATAGAALPAALKLEYVIPLFLAGEVTPRLTDRAVRRAVLAGVVVAVAAMSAPLHMGPMLAIGAGVAAGLTTKETRS